MTVQTADVEEQLESWLDARVSLENLLHMFADVCYGKAVHLETNWKDDTMARVWVRAAGALTRCAASRDVQDLHSIGF